MYALASRSIDVCTGARNRFRRDAGLLGSWSSPATAGPHASMIVRGPRSDVRHPSENQEMAGPLPLPYAPLGTRSVVGTMLARVTPGSRIERVGDCTRTSDEGMPRDDACLVRSWRGIREAGLVGRPHRSEKSTIIL